MNTKKPDRRYYGRSNPVFLLLSNLPPDAASTLAETLIKEKKAACVTLTPVTSVYEWEGKLCRDEEITLQAKVGKDAIDAARERILELHPYELPEIIAIPVDLAGSHMPYVEWVRDQSCSASRNSG